MGFESLLVVLGIEPITAIAIGVTAGVAGVAGAVLGPVVTAVTANSSKDLAESIEKSSDEIKKIAKSTLVVGFEALDTATSIVAETQESVTDLWKDAANEYRNKKIQTHTEIPISEVKIE